MYSFLHDAAHENLELLQKNIRCRRYARMEAMLLSSLTIEAYLNHIGPFILKSWQDIERSLQPKQKLTLILEIISYDPSMGERPYQTFHEMFKLRNLLVHGRKHQAVDHISDQQWNPGEFPQEPSLDIDNLITDSNAKRFVEDMDAIIKDLAEHPMIKDIAPAPGIMGKFSFTTDI